MGRQCYVHLRCRHNVPIRRRGDVPLRRLGNIPSIRRWVFHWYVTATSLGRTERRRYDVATTSCWRVRSSNSKYSTASTSWQRKQPRLRLQLNSDSYSEHSRTSKMELFSKIFNGFQAATIFTNSCLLYYVYTRANYYGFKINLDLLYDEQ